MVEHTMGVTGWLRKQLELASPDLLRVTVKDFAEALCGAGWGARSPERVNRRNGYRGARLGHARGLDRARRPEAKGGRLLP